MHQLDRAPISALVVACQRKKRSWSCKINNFNRDDWQTDFISKIKTIIGLTDELSFEVPEKIDSDDPDIFDYDFDYSSALGHGLACIVESLPERFD